MKQEGLTYEEFAEQWANFDFNKTMNDIVRKRRESLDIPTMATDFVKEHGLPCPYGYEFRDENGNIINTQKIVLEKKKLKYPTTYEECANIMQMQCKWRVVNVKATDITNPKRADNYELPLAEKMDKFIELIICRDAYWRLAREWKPIWEDMSAKYTINDDNDKIVKNAFWYGKQILAFPTEEMRDAFYENFKDLIEECKELL